MFLIGSAALAADEEENGFYFGGGAGRSYLARGAKGASGNVDPERSSAAKVFLGYQFRPPIALELTQAWCGTVTVSGTNPAVPSETLHMRALTFQVVGTLLRVENLALQARIGGLAWRAFPRPSLGDNQGLGIAVGMNLKFDIGKNVAVRADLDLYRNSIEASDFRWGANVVSVSMIGSFK
jgi:hypothetical protein